VLEHGTCLIGDGSYVSFEFFDDGRKVEVVDHQPLQIMHVNVSEIHLASSDH